KAVEKSILIQSETKVERQILEEESKDAVKKQRFSLQALRFSAKSKQVVIPPSHATPQTIPARQKPPKVSRSTKRAQKSALAVRSLIVGPASNATTRVTPVLAQPELSKVKSQLIKPKSANKLIAQLRELPASTDLDHNHLQCRKGPIHAVCLEHTELEEDALHFVKLKSSDYDAASTPVTIIPNVASAPVATLSEILNDIRVVDLLKAPDLGLGQPADGKGLLAGALPTPGTVLNGAKKITPELMNLGYATGRFFAPDHSDSKDIYPPTDRMSVLTCKQLPLKTRSMSKILTRYALQDWWGLEVVLPPPSLEYLSNAQNITSAIMNFLSALSLVNNGVREILPFVRYISQFIDFEFNAIKRQDRGQGVVCAATWIMPAAMVPRPWDFPTPPETQPESPDHPEKSGESKSNSSPSNVKTPSTKYPISSPLDVISNQPIVQLPA
ncbi:hypothetical protein CVT24_003946, partial [Panaeolus cyanescens]